MAGEKTNRSEILKWQDKNGNLQHDDCPDDDIIGEVRNCPACKPNPNAVLPNWKKKKIHEPWFNEKYCTYQVAVVTRHTTLTDDRAVPEAPTSGEAVYGDSGTDSVSTEKPATEEEVRDSEAYVNGIFEEYMGEAIESLLEAFSKKSNDAIREDLSNVIQFTKYHLGPRNTARVRLLYTIPYDDFAIIEAAPDDSAEEEEETGPIVVEYVAHEIAPKLNRFRRAMDLYSRYYRVFNAVDGGVFVFDQAPLTGKVFTKSAFDKYGDGLGDRGSLMYALLQRLDDWLNQKGLNIFGVGDLVINFGIRRVERIEFTFSEEYELVKLRVWPVGCPGTPLLYNKSLNSLKATEAWKDPTACAYFAQLDKLDAAIQSRVETPWTEIIETYTWPRVVSKFNYPREEVDSPTADAMGCVGQALGDEMKQLGQDIMDDVFGLGDALAYAFNKNLCKRDLSEAIDATNRLGITWDPLSKDKDRKSMMLMAREQAYKQLEKEEQVFAKVCASLLESTVTGGMKDKIDQQKSVVAAAGGAALTPPDPRKKLDEIFDGPLAQVKQCGLQGMLLDAIKCMFKGLTLEKALASVAKAALENMNITTYGDLFMGLPPEKQDKLNAMVQEKLDQGDFFKAGSGGEDLSQRIEEGGTSSRTAQAGPTDVKFFGKTNFVMPWDDAEAIEAEKRQDTGPTTKQERTLAQQYEQNSGLGESKSPADVVLQAYTAALIEEYGDDLLGLIDLLNKYPGAQIVASIIALLDCPTAPLISPSFLDFIKSIELPFCKNINDITLPGLVNPFGWIADWADFAKIIFEVFKLVIMQTILSIIIKLIVKLCELIGDAMCKALEVTGDVLTSLPSLATGRTQLADVVRESICGPDADDQKVEDTIADMFEKLGIGGAALADRDAVMNFAGDLSSAVTAEELTNALLGAPSDEFLELGDDLLEFEYPQFRDGLPNKQGLADFFGSMGNLFPADVRSAMQDMLNDMPETAQLPANPSLCASEEDLNNFRDLRCSLLEGRATPTQCRAMFDDMQQEMLQDLDDIGNWLQKGTPEALAEALPPFISSPGCDDGLIPFESEEAVKVTSKVLGDALEQLKVDFSRDMLGNGGLFASDQDWGFINMILSDTTGLPLTAHRRLTGRDRERVDFVQKASDEDDKWWEVLFPDPPVVKKQIGQFPYRVAGWLKQEMEGLEPNFDSNNDWQKAAPFKRSFDDLGFEGAFGTVNINLLAMPDYGYNVDFGVDYSNEQVTITRAGRKDHTDIQLKFKDNNKGKRAQGKTPWAVGFNVNLYLSDLVDGPTPPGLQSPSTLIVGKSMILPDGAPAEETLGERTSDDSIHNVYSDNARVSIVTLINQSVPTTATQGLTDDEIEELEDEAEEKGEDNPIIRDRKYEFVGTDNTLHELDTSQYPNFIGTFGSKGPYLPQVVLLHNMLSNAGNPIEISTVKSFHDSFMSNTFQSFIDAITSDTNQGWLYGAKYDSLSEEDIEYVVNRGQSESNGGTLYGDAYVQDAEGELNRITNNDSILGVSRMQYREEHQGGPKNRVFYLDPGTYGGTFSNPPVYVKPMKNDGWLGMSEVLFPELSPCKPQLTDLIDFGDIEAQISQAYSTLPEDDRIKNDPDCVKELPYNRILMRPSKAGIQGLIIAACRIYASTHLIKTLATFSTFYPKFPETFSSLYASYIIEDMEASFMDAQGAGWEFFNTFKDEEFWYSFLEQAVQMYSRRLDAEEITDAPQSVLDALVRINDMQESYAYPYDSDLESARDSNEAQQWPFDTLKTFRLEKNYEAIQASQEDAKLVLKEIMNTELNTMGKKFMDNLKGVGFAPRYTDMDYYFMQYFCTGGDDLELQGEFIEKAEALPQVPYAKNPDADGPYYTDGGELSTQPEGEDYVGYYHVTEDEMGNTIYMQGEEHHNKPHGELTAYANQVVVKVETSLGERDLGDVAEYNSSSSTSDARPFILEKYININGEKYNTDAAYNIIVDNEPDMTLHNIYPGTLETVKTVVVNDITGEEEERVVGITGKMGVRYGLRLQLSIDGSRTTLTTVEIDALDLPIKAFKKLTSNSKLLLCLIKLLKDDNIFRLLSRYVFCTNKVTALLAIYNDIGFMASVGELTTPRGDNKEDSMSKKPGMRYTTDPMDPFRKTLQKTDGWQYGGSSPRRKNIWGIQEWDSWDQILLRNSKSRIKRLFKAYYNTRDFNPTGDGDFKPSQIMINNLKSAMFPPVGRSLFGWFTPFRTNPFDSEGRLCKK